MSTANTATESGAKAAVTWDAPLPLGPEMPPPFPIELLPGWLGKFIRALSTSTQTPPDLAGMLALAVLASASAKKAVMRLSPDWSEPLNLYVLSVLEPANRKSAVFTQVVQPVELYEAEEQNRERVEVRENEVLRKVLIKRVKELEKDAAEAKPDEREELLELLNEAVAELDANPERHPLRLLADNATPESLHRLLTQQGGRIAVLSAEGAIFQIMGGLYKQSRDGTANIDLFLRAHGGDTSRVDRISRDSEVLREPALTLGITIQPEVLMESWANESSRRRGLPARFLYSIPFSMVGYRTVKPEPVPEGVRACYSRRVQGILGLPYPEPGEDPIDLSLSGEADELFALFQEGLERRLAADGDLHAIQDWAGKLAGAVARIAALLHVAEHGSSLPENPVVSTAAMSSALTLSDYLIAHALAAFDAMAALPEVERALHLVKVLRRKAVSEVSRRDLHQLVKSSVPRVAQLEPAIDVLLEYGYLRQQPAEKPGPKGGRPPGPLYDVHPSLCRT